MLGAVSDGDEESHCRSDDYITGELPRQFIPALSNDYDEDLIVVLDEAPYLRSSKITKLEDRDDFESVQLPPYSPDMNPVGERLSQLKALLMDRFFEDLDEFKQAIQRGINDVPTSNPSNYL